MKPITEPADNGKHYHYTKTNLAQEQTNIFNTFTRTAAKPFYSFRQSRL